VGTRKNFFEIYRQFVQRVQTGSPDPCLQPFTTSRPHASGTKQTLIQSL